MRSSRLLLALLVGLGLLAACARRDGDDLPAGPAATVSNLFASPDTNQPSGEATTVAAETVNTQPPVVATQVDPDTLIIRVDTAANRRPISPHIYGVSGSNANGNAALQPSLESWGGNPSTRFNWRLGNAWNTGSDWFYNNTNYDADGNAFDRFLQDKLARNIATRVAVPTLGWVARDTNLATCSFPDENGNCTDGQASNCENQRLIADPTTTSVASTPADIVAWLNHMRELGGLPTYIAMDNEPELWGYTHYDVHPDCTSYAEILDKYIEYSRAIRPVAPESLLTGPTTCCYWYYWNSAAGAVDKISHGNADFIPWFLRNLSDHDAAAGQRHLDLLDIHYYPEGLYNDNSDAATAAHRLRATRSLWDWEYKDESWIDEPIALIPHMLQLIADNYPGTRLAISEWNFGAADTMNGALAIADVLGIFGREGVTMAAYWRILEPESPGNFAFRMYTNYDGQGGRFGDLSVLASSPDPDVITSFAALDTASGDLHLLLLNKLPSTAQPVNLELNHFAAAGPATLYRYSESQPTAILNETVADPYNLTLPPYSITLLVIPGVEQE